MKKLNKDQNGFVSSFLNGLAIAWFTGGVITPIFVGFNMDNKTISLMLGALVITFMLLLGGIRNLNDNHN